MTVLRSEGAGESGGDFYAFKINQSLRFDGSTSVLAKALSGTASSTTSTVISFWAKRCSLDSLQMNWASELTGGSSHVSGYIAFAATNVIYVYTDQSLAGTDHLVTTTTAVFRDLSSWYHIAIVYNLSDSTTANKVKIYVNGVQQATGNAVTGTAPTSGLLLANNYTNYIGNYFTGSYYFDGYLAEFHAVDGVSNIDHNDFGETKDGIWVPKNYSGGHGNNGYYLPFDDSSAIGDDESANTNDFAVANLAAHDVVPDSPTNNFATFNVLEKHSAAVLSEGSLVATSANANDWECIGSTMHVSSGKWYCEVLMTGATGTLDLIMGVARSQSFEFRTGNTFYTPASNFGYYASVGDIYSGGSLTGDFNITYGVGDIIGIAIDMDNLAVYFAKNNTYINSGNPASGASKTGLSGALLAGASYQVAVGAYQNNVKFTVNFGQDSTFANVATAQNNADGNGVGDFYYSPPSGFLALCSSNLPDPAIGPTAGTLSTENFNTVLYTGNGSNGLAITGVGFSPDWTWIKSTGGTAYHELHDSVRGAGKRLFSNDLAKESDVGTVSSFDSDGFTVSRNSSYDGTNQNSQTFVAWNWLAGTAFSNSAGANGATIASSGQVNTTAGFSIVTYTGGAAAYTVGHGLSKAPEIIFVFNRTDDGGAHYGFTTVVDGSVDYFSLNAPGGFNDDPFSMSAPTSTVFSDDNDYAHDASDNMVAYCFHSVEGYSKVGSYTGNGNADGAFVYTGFRPAFVLTKSITASSAWRINDAARNPFNGVNGSLFPSTSADEDTSAVRMDFISNGFKLRVGSGSHPNASTTYLYLAFAESPFKFANAR